MAAVGDEADSVTSPDPLPLESLSFTLTRADALAYETLPRDIRGWRLILLLVWMGLAGAVVSQLPEDWVGEEYRWRFWAWMAAFGSVQYGVAALVMTILAHLRAARRVPRPLPIEALDHVDHLEWRDADGSIHVAPKTIAQVVATPGHLFVEVDAKVLIYPARAFAGAGEMAAFAHALERRRGDG